MADEIHAPPRGYKSNVWYYFGLQQKKGSSELDLDYGVCKICHTRIKLCGGRFGNKAELWFHLMNMHSMEVVEQLHNTTAIDRNGESQPSKLSSEAPMDDMPGTQTLRTYSRMSSSTSASNPGPQSSSSTSKSYPGPDSSPASAAPPSHPALSPAFFPTLSSSLSSSLASPSSSLPPYPSPASSTLPAPSSLSAPSTLPVPSSSPPLPPPVQRPGLDGGVQDELVHCAAWSLEEQHASRVLLGTVSQSLTALAQSVQELVESQQEFVQDSLQLQREMVDTLRDFSTNALAMLRDKVNGHLPL